MVNTLHVVVLSNLNGDWGRGGEQGAVSGERREAGAELTILRLCLAARGLLHLDPFRRSPGPSHVAAF